MFHVKLLIMNRLIKIQSADVLFYIFSFFASERIILSITYLIESNVPLYLKKIFNYKLGISLIQSKYL